MDLLDDYDFPARTITETWFVVFDLEIDRSWVYHLEKLNLARTSLFLFKKVLWQDPFEAILLSFAIDRLYYQGLCQRRGIRPDQGSALFIHFAMQKRVKLAHLLSPSPVLRWHVPARVFRADSSWIFRLANVFFFLQLAPAQTLRKPDSRSTCTVIALSLLPSKKPTLLEKSRQLAHWQDRNLSRRKLLSSEHEHGSRPLARGQKVLRYTSGWSRWWPISLYAAHDKSLSP